MRTTEIQTTQNVSIEYELASLMERIIALIIDLIVVIGGYFILASLAIAVFDTEAGMNGFYIYFMLIPFCIFIVYNFLFEMLTNGQSLGKKALKIQVVRLDGQDPLPSDFFLRSIMHFVDLVGTVGILGAVLIGSTPKQQRLGDMIAGTTVIKVKAIDRFTLQDILRISTLNEYEPQYPAIRQFSETDMLVIKNALTRYQRFPNDAHRKVITKLTHQLAHQLGIDLPVQEDQVEFIKTLILDYIVLTR